MPAAETATQVYAVVIGIGLVAVLANAAYVLADLLGLLEG